MKESFEGWIICPCSFVGDGWWQKVTDDNGNVAHIYFCPGCRKTLVGTVTEQEIGEAISKKDKEILATSQRTELFNSKQ